ncbi:MAG: TraB/GumN family protein [Cyanobacteria bacterium P01_D01_bin.71]
MSKTVFARVWKNLKYPLQAALGVSIAVGWAIAPLPGVAGTAPPATISDASDEHFLWQIDTPTNTVYLLGSIHFLTPDSYPLPEVMQAAFEDAEILVLEADIGPGTEAETAMLLLDKALPEPGESLVEVLSPATYGLADQQAEELGLFIETFAQFEPWFLAITLTSLQFISLGFSPEYGIDLHFHNQAIAVNKPVLFLETVEQQFDLFEQLSIAEQRQLTEQTLAEMDLLEGSLNEIVTAWDAGDSDAMAASLLAGFEDYPDMQQIFLSDRNRDWVTQILPWLQADEDYLIVVGALHLVGPDNVLELLANEGYEAEQL